MLISHTHKFIFVHVWKTGGNSVREVLQALSQNEINPPRASFLQELLPIINKQESRVRNLKQHITFEEVRKLINPEVFNTYYKFAFVRNPLSWEVSFYHFITQKNNQHPNCELIRGLGSFTDYVKWSAEHEMALHLQKPFVYDAQGNLLADFLGKYECLQEDFNKICERIGIGNKLLSNTNSSEHGRYLKYYTSETESLVRQILKEDFETFGYF